jgi:hypothetical protein
VTRQVRSIAILTALVGLALGGCGSSSPRATPASIPDHLPVARHLRSVTPPGAAVRIVSPRPGALLGKRFTVRVEVSGFRLQHSPSAPVPASERDVGHLEFQLDGGRYDEPRFAGVNGRLGLEQAVNGFYSPAYAPRITYRRIPAGPQVLLVRLADPAGVATRVSARVRFRVR